MNIYAYYFTIASKPFNGQCPSHIETSQLICRANQLTGFYVRGTLTIKGLKAWLIGAALALQRKLEVESDNKLEEILLSLTKKLSSLNLKLV